MNQHKCTSKFALFSYILDLKQDDKLTLQSALRVQWVWVQLAGQQRGRGGAHGKVAQHIAELVVHDLDHIQLSEVGVVLDVADAHEAVAGVVDAIALCEGRGRENVACGDRKIRL